MRLSWIIILAVGLTVRVDGGQEPAHSTTTAHRAVPAAVGGTKTTGVLGQPRPDSLTPRSYPTWWPFRGSFERMSPPDEADRISETGNQGQVGVPSGTPECHLCGARRPRHARTRAGRQGRTARDAQRIGADQLEPGGRQHHGGHRGPRATPGY